MLHQVLKCLLLIALPFCCVGLVLSQETGTLKARFVYGGDAPEAEKINITKDLPFCGFFAPRSERLIVDKATDQIKNVVLSVFTGRGGSELPPAERTPKTVTLATVNCRFEPHILCLRAGDSLEVVQRDPVGHVANLGFLINPSDIFVIRPNAPRVIKIEKAEPIPIQVTCMSHSWMHAYLIVLDHPFVSVSDDQGKVEIKDLPAGNELVFRLFHESAPPIPEVEIDGQNVTLDRNLIRLMIKPGMNDFGKIVIPAAAFRRD
jgi:hypothetical protein